MKEVILFNICTAAGIVNDMHSTVVKTIIDLKDTLCAILCSCVNCCKQHFMILTTFIAFIPDLF